MTQLHFVYSKFCLVGMVCAVGIEYLTSHVPMAVIYRFFQMFHDVPVIIYCIFTWEGIVR